MRRENSEKFYEKCDLLIFDLDGTLIDSRQDLADAVNAALEHLQRGRLETGRVADFIGDGASLLLERALQETGGSDRELLRQALEYFLDYYRDHKLDSTHTYPGTLAELQKIRDAAPDLLMAVLTNKPVRPSRAICDGLGLSPFFFENYGGDSFPTKKPDPFGLNALMLQAADLRGSRVSLRRTVMIGDSHVDVETARAAGTLSLGCSYGLSPDTLRAACPDALVDSPSQWLAALMRLFDAD